MDEQRSVKSAAAAQAWNQGAIAGLDEAMTRRLVASTVYTESNGGDLAITNDQGYVGRYQGGASWLVEAGLVNREKFEQAFAASGYSREWDWAEAGGMTQFLQNAGNWNNGLSLEQYKASAELQDGAFKTICDGAYRQAVNSGLIHDGDSQEHIAGLLKARHISGMGGAAKVVQGVAVGDVNGTSNLDYYNDVAINQDRLDARLGLDADRERAVLVRGALSDGSLVRGEKGEGVRQLQQALHDQGYAIGTPDGDFGGITETKVKEYQQANHLPVTGKADAAMLEALGVGQHIHAKVDGALLDGVLERGEKGDAVRALQEALKARGGVLGVDGDFGSGTETALRKFQEAGGLPVTGKADRATLESLELGEMLDAAERQATGPAAATPTVDAPAAQAPAASIAAPASGGDAAARPLGLADPNHPDHALYADVVHKLEALGDKGGFVGHAALERAAGQIVFEAKVNGMQRVDHVVPSASGGFIAVQGELRDPAHQRAFVDGAQAVRHSVEDSSRQIDTLNRDSQALAAQPAQPAERQQGMAMH
jgi:peptidoglycan hydrolase-like protein with peptidoglycan-binding domain